MDYMLEGAIFEVIHGRRSIRKYTDQKISKEAMHKLIEAASLAPSGSDSQAWEFIILTESEKLKKMLRFCAGIFSIPPAVIFFCTDVDRAGEKAGILGAEQMSLMDNSMAAENVMLAAYAMGMGTCAIKSFDADVARMLLNVPEHIRIDMAMTVGYPDQIPSRRRMRPKEEFIHWERW
jgi:nitroreductase